MQLSSTARPISSPSSVCFPQYRSARTRASAERRGDRDTVSAGAGRRRAGAHAFDPRFEHGKRAGLGGDRDRLDHSGTNQGAVDDDDNIDRAGVAGENSRAISDTERVGKSCRTPCARDYARASGERIAGARHFRAGHQRDSPPRVMSRGPHDGGEAGAWRTHRLAIVELNLVICEQAGDANSAAERRPTEHAARLVWNDP